MYIVIICSLIAILLTYLDSRGIINVGMKWGFILVTLLAVLHYNYGNDYKAYYSLYQEISTYDNLVELIKSDFYRDSGWIVVNYIFRYFGGFFSLVATISIFQGWAYYQAIKRNLPRHMWVLGIIIYLLVPTFYLYNFSMLRQGFVIAVFLSLWPLIEKRKWWIVAPLLYLSSLIHGSALILIPFAFWGYLPVKNGKVLAISFLVVLIALYFSSSFSSGISHFVFSLTGAFDSYLDTYSQSNTTRNLGLGFVIYLIPTILQIVYLGINTGSSNSKKIVALSSINNFFIPLAMSIPMIGRVSMYFSAYSVIAIPLAYNEIKDRNLRIALIVLYIAILIYDYYNFFTSAVWAPAYTTFKTIFSVL